MEIFLGLIALLVLIVVIGKIMGEPSPKSMTDENIMARMQSENAWINRYQAQSLESQQGVALKKQHGDKQRYIMELMLELNSRHKKPEESESLAPAMQRTFELIRQGVSEKDAQEQAIAEFVAARAAHTVTPTAPLQKF